MIRALSAALLSALLSVQAAAQGAAPSVPEPQDYRGEPYRAPVPATLAGAQVIGVAEAIALHEAGRAAFIDVLPRPRARPAGLPEGTVWNEPDHDSIPGATWLWDTGYQALSPAEQTRLRDGIARARADDPGRPLVFFCRTDCWMSWNAARRALDWGHAPVIWFPGGTDAWAQAGRPLVTVPPATP